MKQLWVEENFSLLLRALSNSATGGVEKNLAVRMQRCLIWQNGLQGDFSKSCKTRR